MTIGTITQELYIRTLPQGVVATVTNVILDWPDIKDTDWWPTFSGNGKTLSKRSTVGVNEVSKRLVRRC